MFVNFDFTIKMLGSSRLPMSSTPRWKERRKAEKCPTKPKEKEGSS